jgi:acetyltransferase-like isoleucine patch superfamily enzyme
VRAVSRDSLPHLLHCLGRAFSTRWHSQWARLAARWWGVLLAKEGTFLGQPCFRRHPHSRIAIGPSCEFISSPGANLIGVNRPCIIATLKQNAVLTIGNNCGFSGTVIGCADRISIGRNVRCGANTLITDTDWHTDDPRSGPDAPVVIGDDVWLGVNVTVLKGVTIGCGTMIGAGSLVTKSLPERVVAAGVPAQVLYRIDNKKQV